MPLESSRSHRRPSATTRCAASRWTESTSQSTGPTARTSRRTKHLHAFLAQRLCDGLTSTGTIIGVPAPPGRIRHQDRRGARRSDADPVEDVLDTGQGRLGRGRHLRSLTAPRRPARRPRCLTRGRSTTRPPRDRPQRTVKTGTLPSTPLHRWRETPVPEDRHRAKRRPRAARPPSGHTREAHRHRRHDARRSGRRSEDRCRRSPSAPRRQGCRRGLNRREVAEDAPAVCSRANATGTTAGRPPSAGLRR